MILTRKSGHTIYYDIHMADFYYHHLIQYTSHYFLGAKMKLNLNRIALAAILVTVILTLVLAPMATSLAEARDGFGHGGMGGGGMGFRGGMGHGGMGFGHGGFGHGGFRHGGFGFRHGGFGFRHGGWWNRPWWNNWWGGGWGGGGSICPYWNCVNLGYGPQYCASVCGVY
jgi:hypothetical protein